MARAEQDIDASDPNNGDLTDSYPMIRQGMDVDPAAETSLRDVSELRQHARNDEVLDDDDATNTFAALPADAEEIETDDAPTIRSLNQLEVDLHQLQASWRSVEQQLSAKDDEISNLHDERDMHMAAFKSLQLELDEQLEEHQELIATMGDVQKKLETAESRIAEHDSVLAAKQAELEAALERQTGLDNDYKEALETCEWLRETVAKSDREKKVAEQLREEIEASSVQLKVEIQSLEDYIDGRKAEWDALHLELASCRNALAGMESELREKDAQLAAHDAEKASLTAAIIDLQQRCAELDGRRAEREAANRELNELLAQKGSEVETLTRELANSKEGSDATLSRMEDQAARIASLEGELVQLDGRIKDIRRAADAEVEAAQSAAKAELKLMQERIDTAEASHAEAKAACEAAERRAKALDADVESHEEVMTQLRDANTTLEGRLIDESQRVTQLREELASAREAERVLQADFDDYQRRSSEQIEAHVELIGELEGELERRNAAIELLQKNADTLGRIQQNVQQLDAELNSGCRDRNTHGARRLLVATKGMPEIKFPIFKQEMTIGRSRDNDIQVRRKCISRHHAQLVQEEDGMRIRDLGSKNGLYVNNEPVTDYCLRDGDSVDIGEVQFRYIQLDDGAK